ncbi:hypothetical protein L210DRAFT_3505954 [Boletus edulis BED1]|uniref:Uncharacterized protein n=1 Tax=Boletus edulis BED1 TaxID=1328754 RepID=A0AAD4GBL7_BOLED|nr:hypothetical protein L210DRAFT_3505954 [Boletus edulis BED1]
MAQADVVRVGGKDGTRGYRTSMLSWCHGAADTPGSVYVVQPNDGKRSHTNAVYIYPRTEGRCTQDVFSCCVTRRDGRGGAMGRLGVVAVKFVKEDSWGPGGADKPFDRRGGRGGAYRTESNSHSGLELGDRGTAGTGTGRRRGEAIGEDNGFLGPLGWRRWRTLDGYHLHFDSNPTLSISSNQNASLPGFIQCDILYAILNVSLARVRLVIQIVPMTLRYLTPFFKSGRQPFESGIHIKHVHKETQLAIAAKVPPEVIVMILREIPRLPLPPLDLFSSTTLASSPCRSRILDVALVSAPLICTSWRGPATEVLYEHINLQTMEQCEILYRTLRSNPSFGSWVKVLHLPRDREKAPTDLPVSHPAASTTTDVRLLQLSADIFKACDLVQEIDIMAEVSISYYLQAVILCLRVVDWSFFGPIRAHTPTIHSRHQRKLEGRLRLARILTAQEASIRTLRLRERGSNPDTTTVKRKTEMS